MGLDAEHVHMMVVASRPGVREFYVPILPSSAHVMQANPVPPIPQTGFRTPSYLNFTHVIRGRLVILEDGKRLRAPAPGPKGVHVQQLGINSYPHLLYCPLRIVMPYLF